MQRKPPTTKIDFLVAASNDQQHVYKTSLSYTEKKTTNFQLEPSRNQTQQNILTYIWNFIALHKFDFAVVIRMAFINWNAIAPDRSEYIWLASLQKMIEFYRINAFFSFLSDEWTEEKEKHKQNFHIFNYREQLLIRKQLMIFVTKMKNPILFFPI